jgi:hypothetical protein
MSYGPIQVFTGLIASGASTSSSFDLGGKAYSRVFVEVSSMSTAAAMDVWGSSDGTTFRPVFERVNTAPVQYQTHIVASGVGANGGIAPLDVCYQYVQFRASAVVSGGVTLKLHCSD